MKKFLCLPILLLAVLISYAQDKTDWANTGKYAEANKTVAPGTVVFMGNSITEGWARIHPDFFTKNNYTCRGISGQTSSQMLVRFRNDVLDVKPKTVVILAGTNDIALNGGYISLENIMGNIISMCELAVAHHITPVLCSVLPADHFRWRSELQPANDIMALNTLIKNYAAASHFAYVDYHTAMKNASNGLPENLAKDGVHPTEEGYNIMEAVVQKALLEPAKPARKPAVKNRKYLFSKE